MVDITCDVQQIDETGYVWTFLDEAADPSVIPVHLDVLTAAPERYLEAAKRTHLAAS